MDINYKEIVVKLFVAKLDKDYGDEGISRALYLAEKIKSVYKVIDIRNFDKIIVAASLIKTETINQLLQANIIEVEASFDKITASTSKAIFIEFSFSGRVFISEDNDINVQGIKDKAIIYEKDGEYEYFHTKNSRNMLDPIPGVESYFSPSTFKSLDEALEFYETNVAKTTSCHILKEIWNDSQRIKIISGSSESIMRDSLCQFLRHRLLGIKEVMPEQNVNEKNPVDIKVFWNYSKHIAFIEIKWLGKSVSNTTYSQSRALEGAKQLADYMDDYNGQIPNNVAKGYLVVFDARRRKVDSPISELTVEDVDFYSNKDIQYNPKYDEIRKDFETPKRFFLKAKLDN